MCQKALKVKLNDKKGIKEKKRIKEDFIFSIFSLGHAVRGRNSFREIKSNFSLDFLTFGPSVLVGARGEVDLRGKGYAWTPIL